MKSNLTFRIALRYFFSGKSHGAVNVISGISVAGVAIATAAIIVVLSVFNGFSNITRSRFSAIDSDLIIVPSSAKVFGRADTLCSLVSNYDEVEIATPTITERGLIMTNGVTPLGVVFKGVDENYNKIVNFDDITEYHITRPINDTLPGSSIAVGVASQIGLHPGDPIELYTLRRVGRLNPANPAGAFFSAQLGVDRIIRIDQMEFDADHIIIPIDLARELLQYDCEEASAVEIRLAPNANQKAIAARLAKMLGDEYKVLTREQQHAESYKMIAIEKWVTFIMLIFILIIAAFNIISTLSLMVIEKRDNMSTLRFLGAPRSMVRSVFSTMGIMITAAGGIIGIILGVALSLAQQYGGFIKLSGDQSKLTLTEYPVKVEVSDIFAVFIIVLVVAIGASMTTRIFTRKID